MIYLKLRTKLLLSQAEKIYKMTTEDKSCDSRANSSRLAQTPEKDGTNVKVDEVDDGSFNTITSFQLRLKVYIRMHIFSRS